MTTPTTNELNQRLYEHPMYSVGSLDHLHSKGYTDEQILAFWDRDHAAIFWDRGHAAGKTPVTHATARINSLYIEINSVRKQVHAFADHDFESGLTAYKTGCANVAVSDNYAPTYSFMATAIDTTRRALAERIFEKNIDDLDAGQRGELDAVIRACMLVANVTQI